MVQAIGQTDFVAGGAKLGILDHIRLQKGPFVHLRLGFDQGIVDPLKQLVVAEGEGIVLGIFDGVIGIAASAGNVGNGMAGGAGDAGLGGWIGTGSWQPAHQRAARTSPSRFWPISRVSLTLAR